MARIVWTHDVHRNSLAARQVQAFAKSVRAVCELADRAEVGEALREIMAGRPDRELTVLCGHTHGAGTTRVLPNLVVRSGEAEYSAPAVQGVWEVR